MNFMVNQMNKLQKNRKNKNKGFTLVELIIVIAIIAVLAAVLAPQYVKYVDKSKTSTDESVAAELLAAAKVAVVDTDHAVTAGTIKFSSTGVVASADDIKAALNEYFGAETEWKDKKVQSKTYKDKTYTVTFSTTGATGAWS